MSLAPLRGRVAYVFEEADFDVDQIVGVENIRLTDPDALAACAMRRFDPGFAEKVEPGDVVVGAENFGYPKLALFPFVRGRIGQVFPADTPDIALTRRARPYICDCRLELPL